MLLALAMPLAAQEPAKGKYENKDLGLSFAGIYGWKVEAASGSGAWTKLARYFDEDYDAEAILFVRNNPYENSAQLREALAAEFKEGGEVTAGKNVYKAIAIKPFDMARGNKLPGFEVEGVAVGVTEEGKKRERAIVVATFMGKNRLYRVHCSVRRNRLKNVRDLFTRAASSLTVKAADEKVVRGVPFKSSRGAWSCAIPEGFVPDLPPRGRNYDMQFIGRRGKVRIYVYAYPYNGTIDDQREDLIDFYGDDMKIEKEDGKRWNSDAFDAKVEKSGRLTHIAAAVRGNRAYRIHTSGPKEMAGDLAAIHLAFLKGFRPGR
ncbi:MAG: hypothetical protein AAGD14_16260 [Planctomycetota bacterium]